MEKDVSGETMVNGGQTCSCGCGCCGDGCRECNHFRGLCRFHKILKFLFGLLVVLALLKFICGGCMGWGHRGMMMDGPDRGNVMMMEGRGKNVLMKKMMNPDGSVTETVQVMSGNASGEAVPVNP